jgi:Uma2 family endonuclease
MIDTLYHIIHSPQLKQHYEWLSNYIKNEQQKRIDFYNFITEDMKAEFINGEVIVHSPVTNQHESASSELYTLLNIYVSIHKLGRVTHEKLMISLTRNDYEPDICFFKKEKSAKFKEDQKLFPAPDLVVEVLSKSTEKYDRGIKLEDYALHGIKEYWIVDCKQKLIEKYILKNKAYVLDVKLGKENSITCNVVKGFSIPVAAIFNKTIFLKTLEQISNQKK